VLHTWQFSEGQQFAAGDVLAEIETEKATVELPAEEDGILGRILVVAGEMSDVGAPLAVSRGVEEGDDAIEQALAQPCALSSENGEPDSPEANPDANAIGPASTDSSDSIVADEQHHKVGKTAGAESASTQRLFATPI